MKTNSSTEEKLSALWLIAALLAWQNGFSTFSWLLFMKAFFDFAFSIIYAIREVKAERKNSCT